MSNNKMKVTPLKSRNDFDLYKAFEKLKSEITTEGREFYETLADRMFHNSKFQVGEISISYFEPNNSLRFSCAEGTLTMLLCANERTGDDYIYYREADAPKKSGLGTHVATFSGNGTIKEYTVEAENTDIGLSNKTQKAYSFKAIINELQDFRRYNIPKTVPVEFENDRNFYTDYKITGLETIQRVTDAVNFCRVLTDEERKIAYTNTPEGEKFRRENDPFSEDYIPPSKRNSGNDYDIEEDEGFIDETIVSFGEIEM